MLTFALNAANVRRLWLEVYSKPGGLPAAFGPTDAERAALVAIFDPAKDDEDELEAV